MVCYNMVCSLHEWTCGSEAGARVRLVKSSALDHRRPFLGINRASLLMVNVSWLMAQGSLLMPQGSWLKAKRNWRWVPQAPGWGGVGGVRRSFDLTFPDSMHFRAYQRPQPAKPLAHSATRRFLMDDDAGYLRCLWDKLRISYICPNCGLRWHK